MQEVISVSSRCHHWSKQSHPACQNQVVRMDTIDARIRWSTHFRRVRIKPSELLPMNLDQSNGRVPVRQSGSYRDLCRGLSWTKFCALCDITIPLKICETYKSEYIYIYFLTNTNIKCGITSLLPFSLFSISIVLGGKYFSSDKHSLYLLRHSMFYDILE